MRAVTHDPAPTRAAYRLHRLRLSTAFRRLLVFGPAAGALLLGALLLALAPERRAALRAELGSAVRWVAEQPAFMLDGLAVTGASPQVARRIRRDVAPDFPVSSFDLDLQALRRRVLAIDAVADAALRVRTGRLEMAVTERRAAVVWRTRSGLLLLDAEGRRIAALAAPGARAGLPLIAGEAADAAVDEALRLVETAAPLRGRLRGLVRMGERRWDLVLDRGQRILLPAAAPGAALRRVIALDARRDLLARDIEAVDMRRPDRPTLRLGGSALERRRQAREAAEGEANG